MRVAALAVALLCACAATQPDFSSLVKHAAPAVVRIGSLGSSPAQEERDAQGRREGEDLGRLLGPEGGSILGSGFLISDDGYIVTNAHLIGDADADGVAVHLADGRDFSARLVGADAPSDIALLKIEARELPHVRLGDVRKVAPGQWVAAIGAPLGLESSVSAGIVSAVDRTLPEESYLPFIQTDVAINPGSSGGPLFNLRGEVIGVNTVMYSASGGSIGLSFAVPIDVAMEVARELKAHGKLTRGRIGVRLQDLTPELARALGAPGTAGALLVDVLHDGPAERAGLRSGDVILRFGGKRIASPVDLMRLTAESAPSSPVELVYLRQGAPARALVFVEEAPGAAASREREPLAADRLGLLVVPLGNARRERLGLDGGVLVHRADGAAERAGIAEGDIILAVNGVPVATPYAFHERVRAAGKGASVALLVQRDGARSFVALRLPD
ncbi:MAG TPA: trypsin-like peptidase domain-containing protein [Burkholderiales bacterium]|nr:trypsin-like peptidase domain-containing protein [Burkholderiales bacterium]